MARLYVSDEAAKIVKASAAAAGVSMQAWVEARLLRDGAPVAVTVPVATPVPTVTLPTFQPTERAVTQKVAKESPFEARAHKRKASATLVTNEFGDPIYDD